jgi:hypothetical protein
MKFLKTKVALGLVFFSFLSAAIPLYAFEKETILFYHIQSFGSIAENTVLAFENLVYKRLAQSTKLQLQVIEDKNLVFEKLGIPLAGCTRTECALKIGSAFNANQCMYIGLKRINDKISASARIFDVRNSRIALSTTPIVMAEDMASMEAGVNQLVSIIEQNIAITPRILDVQQEGKSATIDCGGLQGVRLGMKYFIYEEKAEPAGVKQITVGSARIVDVLDEQARILITETKQPIRKGYFLRNKVEIDIKPPNIYHDEFEKTPAGTAVTVYVEANDNESGIKRIIMNYRTNLEPEYATVTMQNEKGNAYFAEIPGADIVGDTLYYYFVAFDSVNNSSELKQFGGAADYEALITSPDNEPPHIAAVQITPISPKIYVEIQADDNSKIASVLMSYHFNQDTSSVEKKLIQYGPHDFGDEIDIPPDMKIRSIHYHVKANDFSGNISQKDSSVTFAKSITVKEGKRKYSTSSNKKTRWITYGVAAVGGLALYELVRPKDMPVAAPKTRKELPEPPMGFKR